MIWSVRTWHTARASGCGGASERCREESREEEEEEEEWVDVRYELEYRVVEEEVE